MMSKHPLFKRSCWIRGHGDIVLTGSFLCKILHSGGLVRYWGWGLSIGFRKDTSTPIDLCSFCTSTQISPLRPQRPKSQVINVIGTERRFSVSPTSPQQTPPPVTPRAKLSFSIQSSKWNIRCFSLRAPDPLPSNRLFRTLSPAAD